MAKVKKVQMDEAGMKENKVITLQLAKRTDQYAFQWVYINVLRNWSKLYRFRPLFSGTINNEETCF